MRTYCSMFSQILKLFSRHDFERVVKHTGSERSAKGLSSWSHFVAMLFCQLGRAHSLREIEGGLKSCAGKLSHLGIQAPARSTLSYANAHRPWQMFEQVFHALYAQVAARSVGKKKFRFKGKLFSLDSTVIDLCLSMYDWAKFRRSKGAVKLHLVLDHDGYLPRFCLISDGKMADVKAAHQFSFEPGSVVVDDRAYNDFRLFGKWSAHGVFFVTRMKDNTLYEVLEDRQPPQNRNIVSDQIITLRGVGAWEKCPHLLRRVEFVREDTGEVMLLLTNNLKLGASTIAAIYKERWQIEIFFKHLKQHLKIKTFVGTSPNAVKIQIWTALIAILLLKFLQRISRFDWSLSNLVAMLRMNLFVYRDLHAWLNQPFTPPPDPGGSSQLPLLLA